MNRSLQNTARSLAKGVMAKRFHGIHKRQAQGILTHIESAKGPTDPSCIRASDQYAADVLGWQGYAPWLYVYSAMAETFKEGWMPDNYYGHVVVPALKGDYGRVSGLRPMAQLMFDDAPVPDVAYCVNGLLLTRDRRVVEKGELKNVLFAASDKVVFKVDDSLQGRGVSVLERDSFDPDTWQPTTNGTFQAYIAQHAFFDDLMPLSVATLRMTTVCDDAGQIVVVACYLRLGRSADSHVQSASHVRVPVDTRTGALSSQGYLTTWNAIDKHPDTETPFAGKRVPCFDECVSTARRLHAAFPYARCIGWDMTVDTQEAVQVMEWNGEHNDIKFTEATQGPCFTGLGWEQLWR